MLIMYQVIAMYVAPSFSLYRACGSLQLPGLLGVVVWKQLESYRLEITAVESMESVLSLLE